MYIYICIYIYIYIITDDHGGNGGGETFTPSFHSPWSCLTQSCTGHGTPGEFFGCVAGFSEWVHPVGIPYIAMETWKTVHVVR